MRLPGRFLCGRVNVIIPVVQEIQGPRRVFKSHLKYNLVPGGEPAQSPGKYIYVYRNPKDTAVSGFHQAQSLVMPDLTWEKYFERFMAGQNSYGMMLDHVKGWWEHKGKNSICLQVDMYRVSCASVRCLTHRCR